MGVVDERRRLDTYFGVVIFRIILGIQVESACLAVCSLLNIDVTDSLMMDQVICTKMLLFYRMLLGSLEG